MLGRVTDRGVVVEVDIADPLIVKQAVDRHDRSVSLLKQLGYHYVLLLAARADEDIAISLCRQQRARAPLGVAQHKQAVADIQLVQP